VPGRPEPAERVKADAKKEETMSKTAVAVRISLALSALVGGLVSTLADLLQKSEASAVLLIGRTLGYIFPDLPGPQIIAIGLILLLAVSFSLIFEMDTKKGAFYLGASVLALLMTTTPYNPPPGFKTEPNSVEVNLAIRTQDGKPIAGALVTLWDADGRHILSRTRSPGSQLRFFQDEGRYQLTIELAGYLTNTTHLSLREGSSSYSITVTLQPSSRPLILQRLMR